MESINPDFLSVDAVAKAQAGKDEERLRMQANNNVSRQRFAAEQRGPKEPSAPKSKASSKPAEPSEADIKKAEDRKRKEAVSAVTKVHGYRSHPVLGPKVAHIPPPRPGDIKAHEDWLVLARAELGKCATETAIQSAYLSVMMFADPVLASMPGKWAIPPGSANFCAMRIQELEQEFAELSVEYGDWFVSGPVTRLLRKTAFMCAQWKIMNESGGLSQLVQPLAASSSGSTDYAPADLPQHPPGSSTPVASMTADVPEFVPPPTIVLPPPMKIYPDEAQSRYEVPVQPPPHPMMPPSYPDTITLDASGPPAPVASSSLPDLPVTSKRPRRGRAPPSEE